MDTESDSYQKHQVFEILSNYSSFYENLSYSVMSFISHGVFGLYNVDSYTFSSIRGTLDSIREVLQKGRINDGYALLRKYHDSVVINIYYNLYLEDNLSLENLLVKQINDWIKGKEKLPEFRVISKYIHDSIRLREANTLFNKDNRYKELRKRCNNHMHYNLYYNLLLNDRDINLNDRVQVLDNIKQDLEDIFIWHFVMLFYLHDYYMSSSDYVDSLDVGLTPEEDSQYYVASFIQEMFDTVIKEKRSDLASLLKNKTCMRLN